MCFCLLHNQDLIFQSKIKDQNVRLNISEIFMEFVFILIKTERLSLAFDVWRKTSEMLLMLYLGETKKCITQHSYTSAHISSCHHPAWKSLSCFVKTSPQFENCFLS